MNRYSKELLRDEMRANVNKLSLYQQRIFILTFSPNSDRSIYETIEALNGKVLKRAYKHIMELVKDHNFNNLM